MSDINVRSLSFSNQGLEVIWTKAFNTYSPSNSNQVHKHKATVWYGISWPAAVDVQTHLDGGRDGFYIANPANAINLMLLLAFCPSKHCSSDDIDTA